LTEQLGLLHNIVFDSRIDFEGALYHVTSRGNARQDIFLDDEDRIAFLENLALMVVRFGWICHAYT